MDSSPIYRIRNNRSIGKEEVNRDALMLRVRRPAQWETIHHLDFYKQYLHLREPEVGL